MTRTRRDHVWRRSWLGLLLLGCGVVGCNPDVETIYGRSRGKSINGTNAFAQLCRDRQHEVRAAVRYNDVLAEWAQVIVRFAPYPGPPAKQEADWLSDWLGAAPGRKVIYIPQDYDAAPEFWAQMLAALPKDAPATDRAKIEAYRVPTADWPEHLPPRSKHPAGVDDWFGTKPADPKKPNEVQTCRALEGDWAEGIDPIAAALPRRESLRAVNDEQVFLLGDDKKLVVRWTVEAGVEESEVLVVANGSFLLNGGLLTKGRRPLATRVVDWIGTAPRHVAFVEGGGVLADLDEARSPFYLLTVEPFNWVAAHMAIFGVLFCLGLAVRIGRPAPEPVGDVERPSAHPVALGAILARTRQDDLARDLIAHYRRWRHSSTATTRTDPHSPSPRRAPRP